MTQRLKINEMFFSLQGEGRNAGRPCSFVRTTGCPLRCTYCDTTYAFQGGDWRTFEDILDFLNDQPTRLVQLTGGEPLAQDASIHLIRELCDAGYEVLLETAGSHSIEEIHPKCHIVMDIKTPGSQEVSRNLWSNLGHLKEDDELKFVLTNQDDWHWCCQQIRNRKLDERFQVLISTVHSDGIFRRECADWVLESGLNVRFQVQLHKILWGEEPGK